jgi:hypothetical protein
MSEKEKTLRALLGSIPLWNEVSGAVTALDELLAEHRAEVEALQDECAGSQGGGEVCGACAGCVRLLRSERDAIRAKVSSTRDAALEEGARDLWAHAAWLREDGERVGPIYAESHAKRLRALKSSPAERFFSESEVREVLNEDPTYGRAPAYMSGDEASAWEDGWSASSRHAAKRLGVDLDAAQETCPGTIQIIRSGDSEAFPCRKPKGHGGDCDPVPRGSITLAGRPYPPGQVYNESEPPPRLLGQCAGCDAQADDPAGQHRFSCSVYGKRTTRVGATKTAEGFRVAEPAPTDSTPLDACECGGRNSRCRRCDGTGFYRAHQEE